MSEYCIETNVETRRDVVAALEWFGDVCDRWDNGSFNFKVHSDREDEFVQFMEEKYPDIEFQLV